MHACDLPMFLLLTPGNRWLKWVTIKKSEFDLTATSTASEMVECFLRIASISYSSSNVPKGMLKSKKKKPHQQTETEIKSTNIKIS